MSASRATALNRLAPDQRAAVELVLRQGRSYGELSDLLGMPEETIRSRARSGIAALAPDLPAPTRAGEIADWLLGQQSEAHAGRTRSLLLSDSAAQRWAATVAAPLREVPGGEAVPELPTGRDAEQPRLNGTSRHAAARDAAPDAADGGNTTAADDWFDDDTDADAAPSGAAPARERAHADATPGGHASSGAARIREDDRGSASRLGGALLISAAVAIVAVVLAFVFLRDGNEPDTSADGTPQAQSATDAPDAPEATATPVSTVVGPNDVLLRGPAGSTSVGLMRLFEANDQTVRFALAAQGVEPNAPGQKYSIWFTRSSGEPRLLGDVRDAVKEDGQLTSAGPGNDDTDEFVTWLQTYDNVVVTLDAAGAKEPGKVILSGALPKGTG